MIKTVIVALAALSLAGCGAGFARLGTYGNELADAKTRVDGREFALAVHPTDDTVLIQRGFGAMMGQSFAEGVTFGIAQMQEPMPVWRRAALWLLEPVGCSIVEVYEIERSSYEARYTCPPGVDLRRLVADNRSTLRAGQPLPMR